MTLLFVQITFPDYIYIVDKVHGNRVCHACVCVCVSLPHAKAIKINLSITIKYTHLYPTKRHSALFINIMNIDFFIGGGRTTNIEHPTTIQRTIHENLVYSKTYFNPFTAIFFAVTTEKINIAYSWSRNLNQGKKNFVFYCLPKD